MVPNDVFRLLAKSCRRFRVLYLAGMLCLFCPWGYGGESSADLRIGVFPHTKKTELGSGTYVVKDPPTAKGRRYSWDRSVPVAAGAKGLSVGDKTFGKRLLLEPGDGRAVIVVGGKKYRGRIEFWYDGPGSFSVINVVAIEDYIKGILTHEMSPAWPLEALRAQAVISRSYVLSNRGRHGQDGFDVCADIHCQVYGGQGAERPLTNRAVEDTYQEILVAEGKPLTAVFHSCCGGRTEEPQNVWEGSRTPGLRSVRCKWCRESPHHRWEASVGADALSQALKRDGNDIGMIKKFRVLSRSKSGRAYEVELMGDRGRVSMKASVFRLMAGSRLLKSTMWTGVSQKMQTVKDPQTGRKVKKLVLRFYGQGWGHGVGLCQWGAKGLADRGDSYKEILDRYYPEARLRVSP